jgi:hypothetical protein
MTSIGRNDSDQIRGDVTSTVYINGGKYSGKTGIVVSVTRRTLLVDIVGHGLARVPCRFVARYHNDDSNIKVLIDTTAFRCSQEILKHHTPLDVAACVERFQKKIEVFLKQGRNAVILEGQRETFFKFPDYNPDHQKECQISAQRIL